MKKLFFVVSVVCFSIMANAQKQFIVDANAEMRVINGSFNSIMISGGIDLYLSQSDREEIAISASEDKFRESIKTVVEDNVLKIYYEGDKNWSRKDRRMRVYVSFKDLEKVEASGASDILVAGRISGLALLLKLSGASDFKGEVAVKKLTMNLSGASDIKISGTAAVVHIESSGASDVKGYDLLAEICTAKASGASDVSITVNKELTAHASGASDIFYKGTAVMKDIQSSGASSIKSKN